MVCERTQLKIFQIVFPEVIQSNDSKCVFTHVGGINVKKGGNGKWDARAATELFLKSLDCLEILENG